MVSKTREKLIEVARQLFVNKGLEKTTMNDIASASEKGRRTIYTYFKNKREIYNAVIERESEVLVSALREVSTADMPPADKLRLFLQRRFELAADTVRHTTLKALISLDYRKLERIQLIAIDKVREMLTSILAEGIADGSFDPNQARRLPALLQVAVQGLDSLTARQAKGTPVDIDSITSKTIDFLIDGVLLAK